MKLIEQYQGKWHCVFVDNYYTSPQLLLDLLAHGTYCIGTVKTKRKYFPVQLIPSKTMNPGTFRFATAGNLTAVWWRDRRDVYALSKMHNQSVATVLKCPKGSRDKQPLPCPCIIDDYNQYMGGVDLTDQHLSYLHHDRTLKWWKKVFWRLIDITIVNAWIIFRTNHPESSINTQKKFMLDLAENLVQPLLDLMASPTAPAYLRTAKGRRPVSTAKCLIGKHFPYKKNKKKRGRCFVCGDCKTSTGNRKDTKIQKFLSEV